MDFRLAGDDEIELVRNLDLPKGEIQRKARSILDALGKQFNGEEAGGMKGMRFILSEAERSFAEIHTDFGEARARLEWFFCAQELTGRVVIDRKTFDVKDHAVETQVSLANCLATRYH